MVLYGTQYKKVLFSTKKGSAIVTSRRHTHTTHTYIVFKDITKQLILFIL